MAGAIQLPAYPEFNMVEDAAMATRWADWLDGFEAMCRAMRVEGNEHKRSMLLHYVRGW